ncbi:MAG: sugar ABC transporter permease [Chloroflexi bacterium]|nr:sugar ABC transporter permease [Chloroflexota bacterium]
MNPIAKWKNLSVYRKEAIFGYLFIAPWLFGFLILRLGPMIASLILSFTDYDIITAPVFVGAKNYLKMFSNDPSFWDSLRVTLTYAIVAVPVGLALSLLIALLLNQKVPGVAIWRTIYYLPSVVSGVAVAMLWVWLFHSEFGLINLALGYFGIHGPAWLRDPYWALPALIIMSFWTIGGSMIINLAGLQGIPTELYEAASLDGANAWHRFWSVTLPMLSPVLFFNLVIGVIETFQYFTNAFVMTNGGPGRSTLFYNLYLYQNAFRFYKMGYASALAWVMFLIILAFTLVIFKSSPYWVYYEGYRKR